MPTPCTAIWPTCRRSELAIVPSIGRAHFRPRQVEARLVDRGLSLRDRRLLTGRDRRVGVGGARPRIGQCGLRRAHLVERILIVGARREAALQQRCLAAKRVALDLEVGRRARDVRARASSLRAQLRGRKLRRGELRLACSSATRYGAGSIRNRMSPALHLRRRSCTETAMTGPFT